ncbi:LOW QUALITY PROTEIN: hypothetical protein HZS_25, partial [Henneguya salminicola]
VNLFGKRGLFIWETLYIIGITEFSTDDSNVYQCEATNQLCSPIKAKLSSNATDYRHVLSPVSHRLLLNSNPTQSITVNETSNIIQCMVPQMQFQANYIKCSKIASEIDMYSTNEKAAITSYLSARTTDNLVKLWAAFNKTATTLKASDNCINLLVTIKNQVNNVSSKQVFLF